MAGFVRLGGVAFPYRSDFSSEKTFWKRIGFFVQGIGSLLLSLLILHFLISSSFSQTESDGYLSVSSSESLAPVEESALGTGISDDFFLDENSPLFGDAAPAVGESPLGEGFGWLVAKVCLFLALLAGMAYGIYHFSGRRALRAPGRQGLIRVLGLEPIGTNRFLQIVDIAGRIVVLGITEQNIQFLTEITDLEAIKTLKADHSVAEAEEGRPFNGHLREWLSRTGVEEGDHFPLPSTKISAEDRSRSFLREERNRLNRMSL